MFLQRIVGNGKLREWYKKSNNMTRQDFFNKLDDLHKQERELIDSMLSTYPSDCDNSGNCLRTIGGLLERLNELKDYGLLYGDNEEVRYHVKLGSISRDCRVVGVSLENSSSKEMIVFELSPLK